MGWYNQNFGSGKKTGVCKTCKKKFSASESYIKTYGYSCIECRVASGVAERERIQREQAAEEAYMNEEDLDYAGALKIWESLGDRSEAKRIRLKMREDGKVKVDQTVVHGDYVDDRDTTVKDSVLNRSNVGAGGKTKGERIKLIKELLDSGAIDKDDYEKMKREIIG